MATKAASLFAIWTSESPGVLLTVEGPRRMEVLLWPMLQWLLWREKRVWGRPAPSLLIFSWSFWHTSDFSHDLWPLTPYSCFLTCIPPPLPLLCSYSVKTTPWLPLTNIFSVGKCTPNCGFQYHFCGNVFQIFIFSSTTLSPSSTVSSDQPSSFTN